MGNTEYFVAGSKANYRERHINPVSVDGHFHGTYLSDTGIEFYRCIKWETRGDLELPDL